MPFPSAPPGGLDLTMLTMLPMLMQQQLQQQRSAPPLPEPQPQPPPADPAGGGLPGGLAGLQSIFGGAGLSGARLGRADCEAMRDYQTHIQRAFA